VYALMRFFAQEKQLLGVAQKYKAGWYGYWHAKLELLDMILMYFWPAREKYQKYIENYDVVQEQLNIWNQRAEKLHSDKYWELKKIVWLTK
jgi:tryptophanyl-tRNA synthetase